MTRTQKELGVRWAIFICVGVVSFVLLSPLIYRVRMPTWASVRLEDIGVTIEFSRPSHTTYVKVDDREETLPYGQEDNSALYQEAMRRVGSSMHREPYVAFSWPRFIRWWGPVAGLAYWLLFRVWRPRQEYLEGGAI